MSNLHVPLESSQSNSIAILTGASLAWNPRTLKEATALRHAGFDVVVYGGSPDPVRLEVDQALALRHGFVFKSVIAPSKNRRVGYLRTACLWLRSLWERFLFRFLGIEKPGLLGPFVAELLRAAKDAEADYYIVHLEQGMWVGVELLEAGCHVGIDMEDWYSEDLLPEARRRRPTRMLRQLEAKLLKHAAHASCPSQAMSTALEHEHGCSAPLVLYNACQWSERRLLDGLIKDRANPGIPSVHWFSQTAGLGRGLEDLIAALPLVRHDVEIHLRGHLAADFKNWLSAHVPEGWRDKIFLHGLVPNEELLSRIAEHDIGFAGEMEFCRNRDLTITNKILYYLIGGLAVLASDTAGQREVAEQAVGAVFVYRAGDAAALAAHLDALLESQELLRRAKVAALEAAERTFCWERQQHMLPEIVSRVLRRHGKRHQALS